MTDISGLVRPQVRELRAYHVEEPRVRIKLHANESPFNIAEDIREAISKEIKELEYNRYPDPEASELREHFACELGVAKEQILLGNGSDELIQMIISAFGGRGGSVVFPSPTFSMYANIAMAMGEEVSPATLNADFELDTPRVLDKIKRGPSITFISYPNNPTGNCFSESDIIEIIEYSEGIVIVDEAYYDYSKKTFIDKINGYPNLIILRTLSKIGLASLRLGILIAAGSVTDIVNRVRLPYNTGSMERIAALYALRQKAEIGKGVDLIIGERERVFGFLGSMPGIEAFRSDSNFILFRVKDADRTFRQLIENGILVRNLNSEGLLKNCLRVTMGRPEENDEFMKVLKDLIV